ncbi:MAG: hypothetical protein ACYDH5_15345 [Acidimicrobiales bacterium]
MGNDNSRQGAARCVVLGRAGMAAAAAIALLPVLGVPAAWAATPQAGPAGPISSTTQAAGSTTPAAGSTAPAAGSTAPAAGSAGTASSTPPSPSLGYWISTAYGGVIGIGGTAMYGSTGAIKLNKPIVGIAATPDGKGYWMVASDGGIFSFGDAAFYGSTGGIKLDKPIVGIAATPDGKGYWMVASDGGIFSFGDAPFRGSGVADTAGDPATGLVSAPGTGQGAGLDPAQGVHPYPSGSTGYDISWPQCGSAYPGAPFTVAIVGVNGGRPFTTNPCLASEAAWAGQGLNLYVNMSAPSGTSASEALTGPAGACTSGDLTCQAYNYGYKAAAYSVAAARSAGLTASSWWMDVETGNAWYYHINVANPTALDAQVLGGAIRAFNASGITVGIYSTPSQWGTIAGNYNPGLPSWQATGVATSRPQAWCSSQSFAGGPTWLVQDSVGSFDGDYAC